MFLAPAGGAIEGWQAAFVFAALLIFVMAFAGIRMLYLGLYEQSYDWRTSKTLKFFIVAIPAFIGLTIWYRVDSHDLWIARADAQAGAEYLIEALGEEQVLNVNPNDVPIPFTSGIPGRPRRNTRSCQTQPFTGVVNIITPAPERQEALLEERDLTLGEREAALERRKSPLEEVDAILTAQGWETILDVDADRARAALISFREDKSFTFAASLYPGDSTKDVIRVAANSACRSE